MFELLKSSVKSPQKYSQIVINDYIMDVFKIV